MPNEEVNHTVDTSGQACPVPVLLTRRGLKRIESGEILEVVGDFPPAKKNIQDYANKHGHEVVDVIDDEHAYRIYIKKGN